MSAEMKQPATANSRLHAHKRPLQRRSAATVSVMLEAAARILEQQGLAGFIPIWLRSVPVSASAACISIFRGKKPCWLR
jgi:hypothetical protein